MKKARLIRGTGEAGNFVLMHGFGNMALTSRVGVVVEANDNVIMLKS